MSTETAAEFHARAQKVMANMGNPNQTAAPLASPPDPSLEKFNAQMEKTQEDLTDLADLAALRRSDGSAAHLPEEIIAKREQIRADVAEALKEYETPLIEVQAEVQAELAAQTDFDPNSLLADLSPEELGRANGLRSFVQDDVASLPASELAPAIEAAIARNDRPALVLYLRELPKRAERLGRKKLQMGERLAWAKLEDAIKKHITPPDDGKRTALQKRYKEITLARSAAVHAAADGTPTVRV